jgi:hypothetical protein
MPSSYLHPLCRTGYPAADDGVVIGIRASLPFNRSSPLARAASASSHPPLFRRAVDVFSALAALETTAPHALPATPANIMSSRSASLSSTSSLDPAAQSYRSTGRGSGETPSSNSERRQPLIMSPQRDYISKREWSPAALDSRIRGNFSHDRGETALPERSLYLQLTSECARELGVGHVPIGVLIQALAASSSKRGRLTASAFAIALASVSSLLHGADTAAIVLGAANDFVAATWAPLTSLSRRDSRSLSSSAPCDTIDFRLAVAASLPLLVGSSRTSRLESLWKSWGDNREQHGAAIVITERALSRAVAAVVIGAGAAASVTALRLGSTPPEAVDAYETGRTLAALAFKDMSPGGAPAQLTVAQFEAWGRLRDVNLLCCGGF